MDQFDHTPYRYQIYKKLRQKIIYKGWKSGTVLSEGDLAKSFGTSRTPIREAIRQLETEGLVKVIPKKGILISTISEKDIKDISELLEIIECRAVEKIIDQGASKEIERLEDIINEVDKYNEKEKANELISLYIQFHETIIELSGNAKFVVINKQLRAHLIRFIAELHENKERRDMGWKSRKDILAAIKKGDKRLALNKLRAHYRRGEKYLLEVIRSSVEL